MIRDMDETFSTITVNTEPTISENDIRRVLSLDPEVDVIPALVLLSEEISVKTAEHNLLVNEINYLRSLVTSVLAIRNPEKIL